VTDGQVEIELLIVPGCPHALAAQELLRSALLAAGLPDTSIRVSLIETDEQAFERGFVGSPTILINSVDPFGGPGRPPALATRLYPGPGSLPSAEQLHEALAHPSTHWSGHS
jgi:hypothetical protein